MTSPYPNILFITIDCLRADVLGCYGGPARTPALDKLAGQGVRYQRMFAHSHMTKTTFPSIFSGSYPSQFGGTTRFDESRFSIVGVLRARGYQTLGVNSNPWLSPSFGFHRGYADYRDLSSAKPIAHSWPVRLLNNGLGLLGGGLIYPPYPSADEVTEAALQMAAAAESPFFLWLHYMDAHWPYDLPRPRLYGPWDKQNWAYNARLAHRSRQAPERVTPREREALRQLYLRGVETIDAQVGRLLAAVGEETAVLLTADHGEAFGEHGRYFHQLALHAENVNVPFLLRHPQIAGGQVENGIVRHIDIAPTLLEMVGLSAGPSVMGVSLLPSARGGRPFPSLQAISESGSKQGVWLSLREDGWAALILLDRDTLTVREEALYHIHDDPGETTNLAVRHPDKMAAMRSQLTAYVANVRGSEWAISELSFAGMDEELRRRLESLGYIE